MASANPACASRSSSRGQMAWFGGSWAVKTSMEPALPPSVSPRRGSMVEESLKPQRHVLRLQVLANPLEPPLAAEPRLLDAAEWRGRVGHDALVEPDHARFDPLAHPERAGMKIGRA